MKGILPRVFVSSVIEGFEPYRRAAEAGIRDASMTPVMVNEQFPAMAASSRNVCLDAVTSCDVFLLVIGERGGWEAPSGKLVVEEELDQAIRKHLPVLVFLQEGTRDATAAALASKVSAYVGGRFRRTFSTPEALGDQVTSALIEQSTTLRLEMTDLVRAFEDFASTNHNSYQDPRIKLRVVPMRADEVVDPIQLGSTEVHRALTLTLMQQDGGLFDVTPPHRTEVKNGSVHLIEGDLDGHEGGGSRLAFDEQGHCNIEVSLGRQRGTGEFDITASMVVDLDDVERALASAMRAVGAFYAQFDAYNRHTSFAFNCGLWHLGHRTLARNPQKKSSHRMRMNGNEPLIAYDDPREIGLIDLKDPQDEVARAIARIERLAAEGF